MSFTFFRRIIRPTTWYLYGKEKGLGIYLLIGENSALLIDPGQFGDNLSDYVESITDLPISVFYTNGSNVDYSGANGPFADYEIYMSSYAALECKNAFRRNCGGNYYNCCSPIEINDGFVFDLGNRKIETIEIDFYSKEGLFFLDHMCRILFTGNEIKCGITNLYINKPKTSVECYFKCLMRLNERREEFDMICPGLGGTPVDALLIDSLIENCQRILRGIRGVVYKEDAVLNEHINEMESSDSVPELLCNEWKDTIIIYNPNQIYEGD